LLVSAAEPDNNRLQVFFFTICSYIGKLVSLFFNSWLHVGIKTLMNESIYYEHDKKPNSCTEGCVTCNLSEKMFKKNTNRHLGLLSTSQKTYLPVAHLSVPKYIAVIVILFHCF
jgi:hypothetical protein